MKTWLQTALVAALFPLNALAQSGEWVSIDRAGESEWSLKKNSFEATATKGGEPISVVVGRMVDGKSKQVTVAKWYVSDADCIRGMGMLVTLSVSGTFMHETEFVKGAGSVGSNLADIICGIRDRVQSQRESKGI